ncbi:hypothetical protein ES703_18281 [subsurface metagenome]
MAELLAVHFAYRLESQKVHYHLCPPDIRHRAFWGPPTDGLEYGWVSNSRLECDEVEVPN